MKFPITKLKTGVQGYLFAFPPKAGQLICEQLAFVAPVEQLVADTLQQSMSDKKIRLRETRLLEPGSVRDVGVVMLRHWSGKCAATGLEVEALLRASHIKPWRDSDNRERLDFNGIVLDPAYDAAFDAGLITFADEGAIVISQLLPGSQQRPAYPPMPSCRYCWISTEAISRTTE